MTEIVKLSGLKKALNKLKDGYGEVKTELDRDGVIQRFEFTFDLTWKAVQEYARFKGLEVVSPRDAFRVGAQLGIIKNPETWFDFLKDRNESTHLYNESQAKLIYSHIQSFINEVEKLIENLSKEF